MGKFISVQKLQEKSTSPLPWCVRYYGKVFGAIHILRIYGCSVSDDSWYVCVFYICRGDIYYFMFSEYVSYDVKNEKKIIKS